MSEREEHDFGGITAEEAIEGCRILAKAHQSALQADPVLAALWDQRVRYATAPPWKRLYWRLTRGRPWWETARKSLTRTPPEEPQR